MYTEFYGLKELPFALTPDPRYIYFTPSHTEVMANLHYGIESGRGLIVVTGEVGTGKTTMLRWVMQRLDRTVLVAYIFNPRLSVPEFYQHLRQLKQRVSLRSEITALPNVEETAQYIHSRLKIAGAPRANIFSPGAIDYIFRCSEGIPRNINNLCDNALLNGFAAGESVISRAIVEEVAATFDMVPRADRLKNSEEREGPARIFNAAGRAELWAAGNGDSGNGNGSNGEFPTDAYSFTTRVAEPEIIFNEHARQESPTTIEELGSAFNASGLGSLSVPPALAGGSYFDKPSSTLNPPANAGGTDRFGRGNNGQNL